MMRSLYSGVSGLRTHQTRMDVIGNNIANVNTTAFKAKQMNFSDMLYQTTQAATGANASNGTGGTNPRQIGLGVKAAAINTTITQEGANQSTGNPFDLKISGEAFFVVSDGTSTFYTRDGSFDVDDAGNLCMASTGYIVQGWGVDDEGNIVKGTVGPIKTTARNEYAADATTQAQINGIIDRNDVDLETEKGKIVSMDIYDKAGYAYNLQFGILPVTTDVRSTRDILNTENSYTLNNIYKVDTSELTFTYEYTDVNGNTTIRTLSDSDSPELMEDLRADVWKYVAGDTTSVTAYDLQGTHVLGAEEKGDDAKVTIDLSKFIDSKKYSALTNGELRKITKLTVNFSGGYGFIQSDTTPTYPLSSNINVNKISDDAAKLLYDQQTATPANNGAFVAYNVKNGMNSVTSLKQTYTDDDNKPKTDYLFKDAAGNEITVADNLEGDVARLLKNLNSESTIQDTYTTQEEKLIPTVEKGKFTIDLLGMLDSSGANVDISRLTNNGTSSWSLEFNTSDGSFKFVDTDGSNSFDVNLSLLGDNFENVTIDASGTSNVDNSNKSTVEGKRLDGTKVGKLLGVSVGTDGIVTASYSNGHSTRLGQICVAKFANAMGLENAGDNLYQTTASSGDASLVDIKAEGIGSITSGILEMSNVDLSQEFTNMITTQRGFQANSRTITVSDTLLEELINLKR